MTNNEIIKQLESLLSHCKSMIEKDGGFPIWEKDCEALEAAIAALRPNGEALTLEQLREMDGEPVWIVEHPDWGHWELSADAEDYIADRDQDLYGLKHDDPAGQCGLHVLGWLAYRRPPEGDCEIKACAETCDECGFCDNTLASPPEGQEDT